jgi:hypothetical protein
MSILQGGVMHWFMYFSADSATKSGIWFQGVLLAMTRGVLMSNVNYVNGHCHHESSKRHAGFLAAEPIEHSRLLELYPWSFPQHIPEHIVRCPSWETSDDKPSQ